MKSIDEALPKPRRTLAEILAEEAKRPKGHTCPEHVETYGPNGYPLRYSCPKCEHAADVAERNWRELHSRWDHWRRRSGVPIRNRNATPDRIQPVTPAAHKMATAIQRYAANLETHAQAGTGFLLLGPIGLGKTVAMAATVNVACQRMHGPIYAAWPDVMADMKAGFSGARDDERRQIIERLKQVPLLALDELGVKSMTDFEHSELFGLIDYRYRHQLPTLAAANATPQVFPDLVGTRVADRLREIGPTIVVSGQSQRGHIAIEGDDAFPEPPGALTVRIHTRGEFRETVITLDRSQRP